MSRKRGRQVIIRGYNLNREYGPREMKFESVNKYIEKKLKILRQDFKIWPNEKEISHLYELEDQFMIDKAVVAIIKNHL